MTEEKEEKKEKSLQDYIPLFNKVKTKDIALFAKETAVMIKSGLHLTQALVIIQRQIKNRYFKQILEKIEEDIKEGNLLSQAMAKYPDVFDRVMINVVKAGEASGNLDKQLLEIGAQMENSIKFMAKIKNAMVYPIFILIAMIGVGILATVKIIPAIQGIITESGTEMPISTRVVLAISNFLINQWYLVIIIIAAIIIGIWLFLKSPSGSYLKDRWLIKEPSGTALRLYMVRFARTLGMLISSGVPIVAAIKIVSDVIGNQVFKEGLNKIAAELERGIPISATLQQDKNFPDYVGQMILVAEQTGQLDSVLINLGQYYEDQANEKVGMITALFEPLILVVIGIGVAFLVFSILVPIYNATMNAG